MRRAMSVHRRRHPAPFPLLAASTQGKDKKAVGARPLCRSRTASPAASWTSSYSTPPCPCRRLRDANNLVDQQNELFQQCHRLAILRNLSCFNYRFCSNVLTLLTLVQSLWLLVLLLI
ncbi:hypothetical protein GQ55_4G048600 [Panicum hallii var. hallii]|uniref:Uncharacterized protein n=1 Tax=Panicum hallii var. hallii TaxID=1504633 RepID=A0A2T7DVB5_9POAL|nr:hypothetical protein GQ55_4G048600 [Panicum hallii var. hallii]